MKVCIICEKEVQNQRAAPVKDDKILAFFRWLKAQFKVAKNNELYVCEVDSKTHATRRKAFEKRALIAIALAVLVFGLFIFSAVIARKFDLWSLVSAFIIALFLILLPLITYTPAVGAIGEVK